MTSANGPAQRLVKRGKIRRGGLYHGAGLAGSAPGQPQQVLGKPVPTILGQRTHPHHALQGKHMLAKPHGPLSQVNMAGHSAFHLHQ